MSTFAMISLGLVAGAGAGLLAGLIGIGGGIVVVPVIFYGLVDSGVSKDQAVHIAVATSLAAILPASLVSFLGHRRAGNTDVSSSGFAGIGGGILTNIIMMLMGLPIHKSIGRAAAAGVAVSVPATVAAALASHSQHAMQLGSIDLTIWACIAPAQSVAAWFGARLATRISVEHLNRLFATALGATGLTMLYSSIA